MLSNIVCTHCKCSLPAGPDSGRPWWHLSNYHGLSGSFCPPCYNMVAHRQVPENGVWVWKPDHPEKYQQVLEELERRKNEEG